MLDVKLVWQRCRNPVRILESLLSLSGSLCDVHDQPAVPMSDHCRDDVVTDLAVRAGQTTPVPGLLFFEQR